MRLWLVRHAQVPHTTGLCYGASDLAADPNATQAAARRLAQALPPFTQARCSPLQRCRALADRLQELRPGMQVHGDARLAEMDFGAWEGRRWDAIGEPAVTAWSADFAQHRPGGGESVAQFMQRVAQALRDIEAGAAGEALWITHAGVAKAVRLLHSGQPHITRADQWPTGNLGFGEWTVLDLSANG